MDSISNHQERLIVFLPGLGAVATTLIAGVLANVKQGKPIVGSITQNHRIEKDHKVRNISELIETASLSSIDFACWDITEDDAYTSALKAGVLNPMDLEPLKEEMSAIKPMAGVFSKEFVPNLEPSYIKATNSKREQTRALREDIRKHVGTQKGVMVWCGSTERFLRIEEVHKSLEAFEKGLDENNEYIAPSMLYAYAALKEGIPFANGAPNLTLDIPALVELAEVEGVPIAGKDFKTGQTFMKTLVAPGLKAKLLGVNGWFSTNILGNKDGLVLNEPENFKTKEHSKLESLNSIFQTETYPELYGDMFHSVKINYYPPRGDQKEGWDNIDIFGWMGYPMQIKINFLCRDSILAAPIVLDLALLLNYAKKNGYKGVQEWMSFFFKHPQSNSNNQAPVHDLMLQHQMLMQELLSAHRDSL